MDIDFLKLKESILSVVHSGGHLKYFICAPVVGVKLVHYLSHAKTNTNGTVLFPYAATALK
jgi:hypothetical protein